MTRHRTTVDPEALHRQNQDDYFSGALDDAVNPLPGLSRTSPDGDTFALGSIELKRLRIDADYHRDVDQRRVSHMVADWKPHLLQTITVRFIPNAEDERCYELIRGKHRVHAALQLNLATLPARVELALSHVEAAGLFADEHTKAKPLQPRDIYRAEVIAERAEAVEVEEVLSKLGLHVDAPQSRSRKGRIIAINSVRKVHKRLRRPGLEEVLSILIDAWGLERPEAFHWKLIEGVAEFWASYRKEMKRTTLVQRLAQGGEPQRVISDADTLRGYTAPKCSAISAVGRVILFRYNKNNRHGRLPDWDDRRAK